MATATTMSVASEATTDGNAVFRLSIAQVTATVNELAERPTASEGRAR